MNLLEHEFATVQTGDRRFHKRSGAAAPSSPGLVTCCGQAGFHSPRRDLLPASNDGKSITHSSNTSILPTGDPGALVRLRLSSRP